MPCNDRVEQNYNHDDEQHFNYVLRTEEQRFTYRRSIEDVFNICVENFSEIFGITINSSIDMIGELLLESRKSFGVVSDVDFNSAMTFLAKKKFEIESTIDIISRLSLQKKMSMNVVSDIEFRNLNDTLLSTIDNLTLGELDLNTLDEMGFAEGVDFVLRKRMSANSNIDMVSEMDLVGYRYARLSYLDGFTLNDMDSQELTALDRTII